MQSLNDHILSLLIVCPLIGMLLVAMAPRCGSRTVALMVSLLELVLGLHILAHWNDYSGGLRYEFTSEWLPQFGMSIHLGINGLGALMVLLTALLTPVAVLASWREIDRHPRAFFVCLLALEAALMGVFCAQDVMLFYVFYEAVLIPMYLIIGIWGGAKRHYAALKYFLYNFLGSVLMWIAMFFVYFHQTNPDGSPVAQRSFDWGAFVETARTLDGSGAGSAGLWLFAAFAAAFAAKSALFPLHTMAPDAYAEAPTAGSVFLSGVLAKMGLFGFLQLALPCFPLAATTCAPVMIALGLIAVVYGAAVAIAQTDFKRTIAYSSISHVGLIVAGIFATLLAHGQGGINYSEVAFNGVAMQMFSHGITVAVLFILLGMLAERRGTRDVAQFGGLAAPMPRFAVLFWIALFASIGLPGLSGFVGEFLLLQGLMSVKFGYAAVAATGVILGAIYMLRLCRDLMFGVPGEENSKLRDVCPRETLVVAILLAVSLWVGLLPQPLLNLMQNSQETEARLSEGRRAATQPLRPR